MKRIALLAFFAISFAASQQVAGQITVPFKSPDSDTIRIVNILHADTLREITIKDTSYRRDSPVKKDSTSKIQSLFGKVKMQEDKTIFYCDSVAINQANNTIEAFGNVHINDADTTNIFSQYMKYYVNKKQILFQKKVTLVNRKGTLNTEELQYDMNLKIGNYTSGGRVNNGPTLVTSKEGTYYAETKDVYFKNNVVLTDPSYILKADSLLYNYETQIATFITQTYIKDSSGRTIHTKEGYYDLKNHRAQFTQRTQITDSSQVITADHIEFDDSTGKSIATGNAVYTDTAQGIAILGNVLIADKKNKTFLATVNPLMILKQEKDSIYITADTLFSGRYSETDLARIDSLKKELDTLHSDTIRLQNKSDSNGVRYMQGFHHVRIFSDSLQAVADSLFYSGIDSVFQLFTNPILWSNGNYQVTGDTIYMYTRNKKADRLYVFENALAINKTGDNIYNQLKGNTINGYFKDGAVDFMRAKGSAESIYFAKDDSLALVGVNRVNRADIIDMQFRDRELNKVILRNDVDGTMFPIRQVNISEMRLRAFKWLEEKRPKSKYELFGN